MHEELLAHFSTGHDMEDGSRPAAVAYSRIPVGHDMPLLLFPILCMESASFIVKMNRNAVKSTLLKIMLCR